MSETTQEAKEAETNRPEVPPAALEVYYDRVIVQRRPDPEKTAGGIVIAEAHRDVMRQYEGIVLEVGHGFPLPDGNVRPLITQRGDLVIFGEFGGKKLPETMGRDLYVLREDEILARRRRA